MRHKYFGRTLSRSTDERKRLFRSLARDLIAHGQIETTLAKAKAVQPFVEHLITTIKQQTDVAKRRAIAVLGDRGVINTLINERQTRFGKRTSGFTRIIRLGRRMGDGGDSVLLSFVDERIATEQIKPVISHKVAIKEPVKKNILKLKSSAKRGRPKKKA